jgi:hypothetical protein
MYIYEQLGEVDSVYLLDSEIGMLILVTEMVEYHLMDGEMMLIHTINDGMHQV